MEFYKVLEDLMEKRNLSILDIARATGLSDSTLRSIISRKTKNISLEVAFKLSEGLNISLEALNGDEKISNFNSCKKNVSSNNKNSSHIILLNNFDLLNEIGKKEAIKRVKELTFVPEYQNNNNNNNNNNIDTIAAHNDYTNNKDELDKINEDIKDMKNWD